MPFASIQQVEIPGDLLALLSSPPNSDQTVFFRDLSGTVVWEDDHNRPLRSVDVALVKDILIRACPEVPTNKRTHIAIEVLKVASEYSQFLQDRGYLRLEVILLWR